MKVFISWSGDKSHAVARVLHEWLPTVINSVEPWISSEGLRAGLKWNQQLESELNGTSFGIIVATPGNQHAQWLNFEAGALSKKVAGSESRVAPLLIDFKKETDLVGPLASYQSTMPTKDGFRELVVSINEAQGEDMRGVDLLERAFEVCWPSLEGRLQEVTEQHKEDSLEAPPQALPVARSADDMLAEILESIRDMNRSDTRLKNAIDTQADRRHRDSELVRDVKQSRLRASRMMHTLLVESGYEVAGVDVMPDGSIYVILANDITTDDHLKIRQLLRRGVDYPVRKLRIGSLTNPSRQNLDPVSED